MRRRDVLAVLFSAAVILGTAAAPTAASADALADIEALGVLRVAVPQDFPPFGSVGPDMAPRGYDIDMAGLIADAMGVALELVPVTSANRIPYLQTSKVDLVISSLGKNAEREAVHHITSPAAGRAPESGGTRPTGHIWRARCCACVPVPPDGQPSGSSRSRNIWAVWKSANRWRMRVKERSGCVGRVGPECFTENDILL